MLDNRKVLNGWVAEGRQRINQPGDTAARGPSGIVAGAPPVRQMARPAANDCQPHAPGTMAFFSPFFKFIFCIFCSTQSISNKVWKKNNRTSGITRAGRRLGRTQWTPEVVIDPLQSRWVYNAQCFLKTN